VSNKIVSRLDVTSVTRRNNKIIFKHEKKEIISEVSLKLIINDKPFVSFLCINKYPKELALGFLYNEGIIDSKDDIEEILFDEKLFKIIVKLRKGIKINQNKNIRCITSTSTKGVTHTSYINSGEYNPLNDYMKISITEVWELMRNFEKKSDLFKKIGGVHSALFFHKDFTIFSEDIGRHNCIDKIVGILLRDNKIRYITQGLMLSSGRISSEIMSKIIRMRIPIYVSRTTPTESAVKLAKRYNITLLGYVRGEKTIIYTGKERIISA